MNQSLWSRGRSRHPPPRTTVTQIAARLYSSNRVPPRRPASEGRWLGWADSALCLWVEELPFHEGRIDPAIDENGMLKQSPVKRKSSF